MTGGPLPDWLLCIVGERQLLFPGYDRWKSSENSIRLVKSDVVISIMMSMLNEETILIIGHSDFPGYGCVIAELRRDEPHLFLQKVHTVMKVTEGIK